MSYNVGPDHRREHADDHECECCGEDVRPVWIGEFGHWECPDCGDEMIHVDEAEDEDEAEAADLAFDAYFQAECERQWKGRI